MWKLRPPPSILALKKPNGINGEGRQRRSPLGLVQREPRGYWGPTSLQLGDVPRCACVVPSVEGGAQGFDAGRKSAPPLCIRQPPCLRRDARISLADTR